VALACAGALLAAGIPAAGAQAAIRSLTPRADGEVRAAQPGRVLATGRSLCAKGASSHAYLRFRVRVPARRTVRAATLRLHALTASGPFAIVLRAVPRRRWSERTLTWRTAPPPGAPVATATGYARGATVDLDASALVKRSGSVEMALTTRSGHCLRFASREARRRLRPRLMVDAGPRVAAPATPWTLVFDDEFDGASLDQSKWAVGNFTGVGTFYAPSNVLLRNGILRLRASAANRSAMVHTHGRYEFTYGRVEASMRVPRGQGFWPSLWLRPANLASNYPEIDLLEMWLTDDSSDLYDERTAWLNYHWVDAAGIHHSVHTHHRPGPDFTAGFHQFAVEWEPAAIRFYIDGQLVKTYTGRYIARVPLFLVMSLQVGHYQQEGIHAPGEPNAQTHFPSYQDVDYVRIYKR
jgi:beta-glucanase (GH16 family)